MKLIQCANCPTRFDAKKEDYRCPDCGTHYEVRRRSKPTADGQCSYNDHGIRCDRRGTIAGTTTGDGNWYCRDHAWVILHDRSSTVRPPSPNDLCAIQAEAEKFCANLDLKTVDEMRQWIRERVKSIGKSKDDGGLDWTRKIMARIEAGERIAAHSERMAREALSKAIAAQREPGEDA